MSPRVIRLGVAVILMAHGLGHALTMLPLADFRLSRTHSTGSWILGGTLGAGPATGLCVILNLLALGAFLAAGLGIVGWVFPREIWDRAAVLGATTSLLGLGLFWDSFPFLFPNKVGVLVVDLWVLASVSWLHWPREVFDA